MVTNSLTPEEVASALSITKNTVYEMVKRGELTAYRVGRKIRIDEKEISAYKEKARGTAAPSDSPGDSTFIICGQDIILDILAQFMEEQNPGVKILRSYKGSYNGLFDLYNDKANVATAHLWDGDSDTYNRIYVKSMLPGTPAEIISLGERYQGFYVKKGNPKKITGWDDFKRVDITFVNREKGSGTRVLLDERLRLMGINSDNIAGYETEMGSHVLVATKVSAGLADFGLGIGKAAKQARGLEFIPLQRECYDLIVKKRDLEKPLVISMLNIINSDEFKITVTGLGGYWDENGQRKISAK